MKKLILTLLITLLTFAGNASAEIIEKQRHKDWESFILTFDGGVCARMSTLSPPTLLIVDIFPRSAQYPSGMYQVKFIEPQNAQQKANLEMMVPFSLGGKMRVDQRSIYDVTFDFSMLDNLLFVNLGGQFGQTLVDEAKRGRELFVRIDPVRKGANPTLTKFSLMGFTAAYNRCMSLLPLLERMTSPAPAPQVDPFADFGTPPAPKKMKPAEPPVNDTPKPEYRNAVSYM